jgi:hypothetical protein
VLDTFFINDNQALEEEAETREETPKDACSDYDFDSNTAKQKCHKKTRRNKFRIFVASGSSLGICRVSPRTIERPHFQKTSNLLVWCLARRIAEARL